MTANEHLDWCVRRAMEYYNLGDKTGALTSFLSDVSKHEGTVHIQPNPATLMILMFNLERGAREFEETMRGFSVFDAPTPAA